MSNSTTKPASVDSIQYAIERVRADMISNSAPEYVGGRDLGKAWAIKSPRASFLMFRRFEQVRLNSGATSLSRYFDDFPRVGEASPVATLANWVYGGTGAGREQIREFCAESGVDIDAKAIFCLGFAEAVLTVWDQVKAII